MVMLATQASADCACKARPARQPESNARSWMSEAKRASEINESATMRQQACTPAVADLLGEVVVQLGCLHAELLHAIDAVGVLCDGIWCCLCNCEQVQRATVSALKLASAH